MCIVCSTCPCVSAECQISMMSQNVELVRRLKRGGIFKLPQDFLPLTLFLLQQHQTEERRGCICVYDQMDKRRETSNSGPAYKRLRPEKARSSAPNTPQGSITTTIVDQTPHYATLTESGRVFTRVADAIAELCDNAIQATHKNLKTMKIEVNLINSFLVVTDNGIGMDEEGFQIFGTYALGQHDRGLTADCVSSISKFGVGAKEAAFYLGKSTQFCLGAPETV